MQIRLIVCLTCCSLSEARWGEYYANVPEHPDWIELPNRHTHQTDHGDLNFDLYLNMRGMCTLPLLNGPLELNNKVDCLSIIVQFRLVNHVLQMRSRYVDTAPYHSVTKTGTFLPIGLAGNTSRPVDSSEYPRLANYFRRSVVNPGVSLLPHETYITPTVDTNGGLVQIEVSNSDLDTSNRYKSIKEITLDNLFPLTNAHHELAVDHAKGVRFTYQSGPFGTLIFRHFANQRKLHAYISATSILGHEIIVTPNWVVLPSPSHTSTFSESPILVQMTDRPLEFFVVSRASPAKVHRVRSTTVTTGFHWSNCYEITPTELRCDLADGGHYDLFAGFLSQKPLDSWSCQLHVVEGTANCRTPPVKIPLVPTTNPFFRGKPHRYVWGIDGNFYGDGDVERNVLRWNGTHVQKRDHGVFFSELKMIPRYGGSESDGWLIGIGVNRTHPKQQYFFIINASTLVVDALYDVPIDLNFYSHGIVQLRNDERVWF